jgi:hypothetical protein
MLLRLLSKPLDDGALLDSRVEPTLTMLDFGDEWRFWHIHMCPRAFLYFLFLRSYLLVGMNTSYPYPLYIYSYPFMNPSMCVSLEV